MRTCATPNSDDGALEPAPGPAASRRQQSAGGASESDPYQESDEHDGEAVHAGPDGQGEHAGPEHLVAERAKAAQPDAPQDEPVRERIREGPGSRHDRGISRRHAAPALDGEGGGQPPLEREARKSDREIGENRHVKGRARRVEPEEHEAGGKRAEHRAQGIDPVEPREQAWQGSRLPGDEAGQSGKRSAHERRGHDESDDREERPKRQQVQGGIVLALGQGHVDGGVDPHQPGEDEREDRDPELEQRVHAERAAHAVHEGADRVGPERQPPHEDREHDGDREMRTSEDQGERPDPHHLVHERGRPGQKEQQVDGATREEDRHEAPPTGPCQRTREKTWTRLLPRSAMNTWPLSLMHIWEGEFRNPSFQPAASCRPSTAPS